MVGEYELTISFLTVLLSNLRFVACTHACIYYLLPFGFEGLPILFLFTTPYKFYTIATITFFILISFFTYHYINFA